MRAFLAVLGICTWASLSIASEPVARRPIDSTRDTRIAATPYDALWSDTFRIPSVNGGVLAVAPYASGVVLGGGAQAWGTTLTPNVAFWNGATFQPMGGGLEHPVRALVALGPDVVAGTTYAGPGETPTVFRFDGNGWSPIGRSNGLVSLAVVLGGDLVVAGSFTSIDGVPAARIARWDGAAWHALGSGLPGASLTALVMHGGQLVAGGAIPGFNGVAVWNGTTWSNVGAGLQSGSSPGQVTALASDGVTLFASGFFSSSGGTPLNSKIAAWNGSTWSNVPGATLVNRALGVFAGRVYASIPAPGGVRVRAWNTATSTWDDVGAPTIEAHVFGVANSRLFVSGEWSALPAGPFMPAANTLHAYDGTTWLPVQQAWSPAMRGVVGNAQAMLAWGDSLLFAGPLVNEATGSTFRRENGAVIWDGQTWQPFGSPGGIVSSAVLWNGRPAIATDAKALAWNGTGWTQLGPLFSVWPFWITTYEGDPVYLGASPDGIYPSVQRWNGSAWVALGTGIDDPTGFVETGVEWRGKLVVGGLFASAQGSQARNLAEWDGATWREFGGGANGEVYSVGLFENDLVASGDFTEAGGDSVRGIARWDGAHWSALGNNADEVLQFRVHGGRLYGTGVFFDDSGAGVQGVAVLVGDRWRPLGEGPAFALDFLGDDLYVSGRFDSFAGHLAASVARLPNAGVLAVDPSHVGAKLSLAAGPNPSRGLVRLSFTLPADGRARLTVHDLAGREVARLADGAFAAGAHTLSWSGRVAPGLYFARLRAGGTTRTARIVRTQ